MPTVRIGLNTSDDAGGGCVDTQLDQATATTNYGSDTFLKIEKWGGGGHIHALVGFPDLSSIPSGATITSATLTLTRIDGSADGQTHTLTVTRLLRNWVEAQATWNVWATASNWTTGGAADDGSDHENDLSATISVTDSAGACTSGDLSAIVQGWLDSDFANYGFRLERTDGADDTEWREFASSEGTDGSRPYLTVDYTEGASLDQEGARFGVDDASESAHTWKAAQDTGVTHPLATNLLLRALIDAAGDPASAAYSLRAQKNGSGGYVDVPVGATVVVPATYFGGASGGTNPTTGTTVTIPASLPTTCILCLHFTSRDHTSGTGQPTVTDNNSGAAWTQKDFSTDRKAQFWWKRYEANLSSKTITIAGAVGSCSARLVVIEDVYDTGDPFTGLLGETNASGNETHAAISPTYPGSAVVFAVHNYANDNAVSSVSAATTGAPGQSTGHLSTGGSDCATHVAVWNNHPASTTGAFTWAQTNGTTYSRAYAVRPLEVPNEVYVAPSANITGGGEATTPRLTPPGAKTTSDATTGRRWDDENGSDAIDIAADFYVELEWCLQAQAPAVNTDYFDFRVYAGAAALDSYGVTPRWTIGASGPGRLPAPVQVRQSVQRSAVH